MATIEIEQQVETRPEVTIRERLHRAADLIEEFGWCQGHYRVCEFGHTDCRFHSPEAFCVYGAYRQSGADLGSGRGGWEELSAGLWRSDYIRNVACWNDQPGRTKAEVVAALRKAADASA
jgi:hypothetical protein